MSNDINRYEPLQMPCNAMQTERNTSTEQIRKEHLEHEVSVKLVGVVSLIVGFSNLFGAVASGDIKIASRQDDVQAIAILGCLVLCMFKKHAFVILMEDVSEGADGLSRKRLGVDRLLLERGSQFRRQQDRTQSRTVSPNSRQNRRRGCRVTSCRRVRIRKVGTIV